jgi:hypothetical protein
MSTIPGYRAHAVELRRKQPFNRYNHFRVSRRSSKTIGMVKSDRLRVKNMRRAEAGLPPKATYAEI